MLVSVVGKVMVSEAGYKLVSGLVNRCLGLVNRCLELVISWLLRLVTCAWSRAGYRGCIASIICCWLVIIYKYHHSTKLYQKISRVCCGGIVTSAKHE